MRIPSRPDRLREAREALTEWALASGLSARAADELALAVHEAVANAVEHGNQSDPNKMVTILTEDRVDRCVVRVLDEGPGVGPLPAAEPGLEERGRGIALMAGLVDDLSFATGRGEVVLVKRKPGREGGQRCTC